MKGKDPKASKELVGIVISGAPQPPVSTVFSAYVYGTAPATKDEPKAAA